ncbi:hypothetical protein ACQP3C_29320, partial [Escherichia coli]
LCRFGIPQTPFVIIGRKGDLGGSHGGQGTNIPYRQILSGKFYWGKKEGSGEREGRGREEKERARDGA